MISANAYLGAGADRARRWPSGADVVITGRVGDPAMFLAPLIHEFGWAMDDWAPPRPRHAGRPSAGMRRPDHRRLLRRSRLKDVAGLGPARLSARRSVARTGDAVITKVAGSGGAVTLATCKEQMLYEVHDPATLFPARRGRRFLRRRRCARSGPTGSRSPAAPARRRPAMLKVSIGYRDSYIGEGQISYAGPARWRAAARAPDRSASGWS